MCQRIFDLSRRVEERGRFTLCSLTMGAYTLRASLFCPPSRPRPSDSSTRPSLAQTASITPCPCLSTRLCTCRLPLTAEPVISLLPACSPPVVQYIAAASLLLPAQRRRSSALSSPSPLPPLHAQLDDLATSSQAYYIAPPRLSAAICRLRPRFRPCPWSIPSQAACAVK